MILRSRLEANIKYVVTTSYSAIKMGFFDKIDNVSDSNIIKKVLHWRSGKTFVTTASQCRTFNQNVIESKSTHTSDLKASLGVGTACNAQTLTDILACILLHHWLNNQSSIINHREPAVVVIRKHQLLKQSVNQSGCLYMSQNKTVQPIRGFPFKEAKFPRLYSNKFNHFVNQRNGTNVYEHYRIISVEIKGYLNN